ncbi:MAG: hypothetical protein QXV16_02575 [Candidatus Anstonellales archaeon]
MEIIYTKDGQSIRSENPEEMCNILKQELATILRNITTDQKTDYYINRKYGYIKDLEYKHEGRNLMILQQGKTVFVKNVSKHTSETKYILHFYTACIDNLCKRIGKRNDLLTTEHLIRIFPELKLRKR